MPPTTSTPALGKGMRVALRTLIDLVRGAMVGVTETIPGVSGGTVALIIGVYETLIDGAGHLARAAARVVTDGLRGKGFARAGEHARAVRWSVVLPVGIGMVIAVFVSARLLSPIIEAHPTPTRALFAGLIAASLIVPIRMTGARWRVWDVVIALVAAAVVFFVMGLPAVSAPADPPLILVAAAAAVAVCALVLPGVSGSYLLLAIGLYGPTLAAVAAFDLPYIFTFALGAVCGLAVFIPVLQWLLAHRRRITLVIMTGLMAGSLRAVWPWQTEQSTPLPAGDDWPVMVGLFVLGAVIVLALLVVEAVLMKRRIMSQGFEADPDPEVVIDEKEHDHEIDVTLDERHDAEGHRHGERAARRTVTDHAADGDAKRAP